MSLGLILVSILIIFLLGGFSDASAVMDTGTGTAASGSSASFWLSFSFCFSWAGSSNDHSLCGWGRRIELDFTRSSTTATGPWPGVTRWAFGC